MTDEGRKTSFSDHVSVVDTATTTAVVAVPVALVIGLPRRQTLHSSAIWGTLLK